MNKQRFMINLGIQISRCRKRRNLSQEALSEKTAKTVNTISKLERGLGNPQLSTLITFAQAFDMKLCELIAIEPDDPLILRTNDKIINRIIAVLNTLDEKTLRIILKQVQAFQSPDRK